MNTIEIGTRSELVAMIEPTGGSRKQVELYDSLVGWLSAEQGGTDNGQRFENMPEFAGLRQELRRRIASGQEVGIIHGIPVSRGDMTPVYHAR